MEEEAGTGSGMGREQSAELLQPILPSHCWEHLGKGMHSTSQNLGDGFQHFGLGSAKAELNHSEPGAVVTEAVEGRGKGGFSGSGGLGRAAPSSAPSLQIPWNLLSILQRLKFLDQTSSGVSLCSDPLGTQGALTLLRPQKCA